MPSNNTIRLSAAGAGKTWGICHDALTIVSDPLSSKRVLITTYTNKGVESIRKEIRKQNMGVLHDRIIVKSWFQFLLSELLRPYQTFIAEINEITSFDFSHTYGYINRSPRGVKNRYIKGGYVLSNFASELAIVINEKSNGLVIDRLEKIYSHIFIDEIQDLAGDDLSIVDLLFESQIETICVGDNKQATYKTHNTQKNKKQSGANIWDHFSGYEETGMVSVEKNLVSRRFNKNICDFANLVFPNQNNITTSMIERTLHDGVFLVQEADVQIYYDLFQPTVLKYDAKTQTGNLRSLNFGQCKGCTFDRVLIYPNNPLTEFVINCSPLKTAYKYYVAVTRARFSVAIVLKKLPTPSSRFVIDSIQTGDYSIDAMRFAVSE